MRRFFLPLFALGALVLMAAAPPSPSPSPAPVPSAPATAKPSTSTQPTASISPTPQPLNLSQDPSVVIFPFESQAGSDPKIGTAIATILQQEMTQAGGLRVLPVPSQTVARTDYLAYAHAQGADFYVSGYVTPIGNVASVVEQVIIVDSGIIRYSETAQVASVADVASQALQARGAILALANRGTQSINSQSSNTPAPSSTNGTQVKLGGLSGIVDSVFHHHSAPTPEPTAASKPSRGVIVAPVVAGAGTVAPADITNATNELYFAMQRWYNASMTPLKSNVAQSADSICGTRRNNTVAAGTIAENVPKHGREVTFTLQVYTCFGALLASASGKGMTVKSAVDAAVSAYVTAHPDNS